MNEVIRQLHQRRSVRSFEDRPIGADLKSQILSAAVQAPTAGCQQLYTIIDVTSPIVKDALADSCDHQPFIAKAPMVLVFCADARKWYDAYVLAGCSPRAPGAGDLLLAVDDALIAAQNAVTAAWSLGIGSCYAGDIMENAEMQREILKLPEYVFPAALAAFGYPTPQQAERAKPQRCDMDLIVHENAYRRLDGGELRRMVSKSCSDENFEEWMRAFCARKYDSGFSREMTRSVRRWLEEFAFTGE
jgi:nitroreductase